MSKRQISVSAVVLKTPNQVLLVKQGKMRFDWELPGGRVKKGESIFEALVREVREETGLLIVPERLIGVFDIPSEGFCDLVFLCRRKSGKVRAKPPEIEAVKFWGADALPKKTRPYTVDRIRDALGGVAHLLPVRLKRKEWLG